MNRPLSPRHATLFAVFLLASLGSLSCAAVKTTGGGQSPDGGSSDLAPIDLAFDRGTGADVPTFDMTMREIGSVGIGCGTGRIDPGEVCDDGNTRAADGCSADCKAIDKDFACPEPNKPCVYLVKCGDGMLGGNERCDPPNPGNGCSATCLLEPGFVCEPPGAVPNPGQPPRCHATLCGDGTLEGAEACDDSNAIDGDGCAASCTLEPDCSTGACSSKCGDAVKLPPEACDDGNTKDGDGCSQDCQTEMGFTCLDTSMSPPSQLRLAATYRDLISLPIGTSVRHPDFEIFAGMDATPLLVKPMLDAAGKPVMDGRCAQPGVTAACPHGQQVTTAANFGQWYSDAAGVNIAVPGTLLLPRGATGAYVYDSGAAGFYPIDGKGWLAAPAREAVATADPLVNDGRPHNFGYTTEIRYFFQYRGGESLTFSGDDDLWIFINRRLALDMGGLHPRLQRTLVVDQSATALGLIVGGLYEIALFHAERHSAASNFKLTLTGFAPTSTICRSACGDGALASSEQCDDGNNVDGDGCSHDCRHEIVIP